MEAFGSARDLSLSTIPENISVSNDVLWELVTKSDNLIY